MFKGIRTRAFLLLLMVAMLTACARQPKMPEVQKTQAEMDIVARELAASKMAIMHELAALKAVSVPAPAQAAVPDYSAPGEFMSPARLVWNGPLEKGLAAVASKIGWQARKFGTAPVQDIIVYSSGTETVLEVLQGFGAQVGQRANIVADASSRTFKLVYPDGIKASTAKKSPTAKKTPVKKPVKKPVVAKASSKPAAPVNSSHKLTPPKAPEDICKDVPKISEKEKAEPQPSGVPAINAPESAKTKEAPATSVPESVRPSASPESVSQPVVKSIPDLLEKPATLPTPVQKPAVNTGAILDQGV